jgi:hypothetical protein
LRQTWKSKLSVVAIVQSLRELDSKAEDSRLKTNADTIELGFATIYKGLEVEIGADRLSFEIAGKFPFVARATVHGLPQTHQFLALSLALAKLLGEIFPRGRMNTPFKEKA